MRITVNESELREALAGLQLNCKPPRGESKSRRAELGQPLLQLNAKRYECPPAHFGDLAQGLELIATNGLLWQRRLLACDCSQGGGDAPEDPPVQDRAIVRAAPFRRALSKGVALDAIALDNAKVSLEAQLEGHPLRLGLPAELREPLVWPEPEAEAATYRTPWPRFAEAAQCVLRASANDYDYVNHYTACLWLLPADPVTGTGPRMVATDGHILAYAALELLGGELPAPLMLPLRDVALLLRAAPRALGDAVLAIEVSALPGKITAKRAVLRLAEADLALVTEAPDIKTPSLAKVLSRNNERPPVRLDQHSLEVALRCLHRFIQAIPAFAARPPAVWLKISNGELKIELAHNDDGWLWQWTLPIECDRADASSPAVMLNPLLLLDALHAIAPGDWSSTGKLCLGWSCYGSSDHVHQALMLNPADENGTPDLSRGAVLMPLRVD